MVAALPHHLAQAKPSKADQRSGRSEQSERRVGVLFCQKKHCSPFSIVSILFLGARTLLKSLGYRLKRDKLGYKRDKLGL